MTKKLKHTLGTLSFVLLITLVMPNKKQPEAYINIDAKTREDIAISRKSDTCTKIDSKTLEVLKKCAKHHTRNIKQLSYKDINRLKNFAKRGLNHSSGLPLFLLEYLPSPVPSKKGEWKSTHLCKGEYSSTIMLEWLKEHYQPKKPIKFFFFAQEPYLSARYQGKKINDCLTKIIGNKPILITCTHPALEWTRKGVLIPDSFILSKGYQDKFTALFTSKDLLPFNSRKPIFFFSGMLTAPWLPFSHKNMQRNPRHLLLEKTKLWSFLKYNVTKFPDDNQDAIPDYRNYILNNFSHLKGEPVDFFEHAKYKYLLSFDGFGSAWSRVPLILATGSVLVLNAVCRQYFYDLMVENQTHVTLKSDLSNGEELFQYLENNPKIAEKIGIQGRDFAKMFLTKEAIDAYLWLVIREIEDAYQEPKAKFYLQTKSPNAIIFL